MVLGRKKTPNGLGSGRKALVPWVSGAANDIKLGTTLYIKELDGVKLPHGEKHNGCSNAYQDLNKKMSKKVTVTEKSCKVKNYVTGSIKKWAAL